MAKLYNSQTWLYRKYTVEKVAISEIAAICGVSEKTIYNKLHEFGIIKKR